jgi:cyclic beta-1,2-glucan synthetase
MRADADQFLADSMGRRTAPPRTLPDRADTTFIAQLLHRAPEYGHRFHPVRDAIDAHLKPGGLTPDDTVRAEHRRQAMTQVSVANAITSLRLCSRLDWRQFVEAASLVEHVLQQDPSGAYGLMDFHSRDEQRRAVEELAPRDGDAQMAAAQRAIASARADAVRLSAAHREAHVGFHLVGPGRPALEASLGHRAPLRRRVYRGVRTFPTLVYLGSVAIATTLLVALGVGLVRDIGGSVAMQWLAALALLLPASDVAIAAVQRIAARLIPPRRLPRLDYADGVPASARTMVVVPTLLTSEASASELVEHLEIMALGNLDPHVHFAILGDFRDAATHTEPSDAAILATARAGIESLNARLSDGRGDRFFLFHRERRWNPGEARWMGWERKRGKIEEFNRRLRGDTGTTFTTEVGRVDVLPSVRYCLTLDTDTQLPRDAAAQLIGIIEHPLNRPRFDADTGRVTQGYGILQPRVSVAMASAAGSRFARIYAGHTGVDPYTTAVSDLYQDLFDEGVFTGKGLYDVDVFQAALADRVPDNTLLSHDLFEGLFARTALVSDVELIDEYPATVVAHARRQHRWVRGDWQILRWLFPLVPARAGFRRNGLTMIARWKIFDNLRRSLVPPATLALFLLGWIVMPGAPWAWTAAAVAAHSFPLWNWMLVVARGPGRGEPLAMFARNAADDLASAAARIGLQLTFLADHAIEAAHAVALTLVRLVWTGRRLLDWETAAAVSRRARGARLGVFVRELASSPIVAIATGVAIASRPEALRPAAPILALWLAAPVIAWVLSRPAPPRQRTLPTRDAALLRDIARRTWHYFEVFMTDEHHGLPPDNVQFVPDERVAHRTSPTNIAMAMLSILSAHEFTFLDRAGLADRLERLFDAIDRLPRHAGHLLNWYDTRTLQPLRPAYVSTVDSGNFSGALIATAAGLTAIARRAGGTPEDDVVAARLLALATRATAWLDAIDFAFLPDFSASRWPRNTMPLCTLCC